jgi:hypothetical protein
MVSGIRFITATSLQADQFECDGTKLGRGPANDRECRLLLVHRWR